MIHATQRNDTVSVNNVCYDDQNSSAPERSPRLAGREFVANG